MSDCARFAINPRPRCGFREPGERSSWCAGDGAALRWLPGVPIPVALCAKHAAADDLPLDPRAPYQRVTVMCQVWLAAVCHDRSQAMAEAEHAVRAALDAVGVVVGVASTWAVIGQPAAPGEVVVHSGDDGGS